MSIVRKGALLLATFVLATTALASGPAASSDHTVVVIADVAHGLALIPEGTPIPLGIKINIQVDRGEQTAIVAKDDDGVLNRRESRERASTGAKGRSLVYGYAPESAFAAARKAIAIGTAAKLHMRSDSFRLSPMALS